MQPVRIHYRFRSLVILECTGMIFTSMLPWIFNKESFDRLQRHFPPLHVYMCVQDTMSLYDDLGVATSDAKTEGWSKNFKLLQSQLKVKKAALTQAKVPAVGV